MQRQIYPEPDAIESSSVELSLMLLCARWPQRDEDRQSITELCRQKLDWPLFLRLTQHHRLVPLVWQSLRVANVAQGESTAFDELRLLAEENSYRAMRSLVELRRIVQELREYEIRVRVLKGLPLAQTYFGDIGLRTAGDIDLLIDECAIQQTDRLLRSAGYRGDFDVERFTPRQLDFYREHWKDISYENPATGFEVDLHWRLFRNRETPGSRLCETSASRTIEFGDLRVETLPADENLLYLCVHGTLDGWLFFKSLADVAALVRTMDEVELDALAELATGYDVLPELSATLILVRRYFAMDHWSAHLLTTEDRTVKHILRYAERTLVQGNFLADREEIPVVTTMLFKHGLRRGLRYRGRLLARILYRARMWKTFPLPDRLFWLYPVLSPVEWVCFRVFRWWERTAE